MRHYLILLLSILFIFIMTISCTRKHADSIFINGNFYTMDDDQPYAEAVAIRGDRFSFVGSNEAALEYAGRRTEIVDLGGHTVIPGMTESHMHFDNLGRNLLTEPLDVYWLSLDSLTGRIAKAVSQSKPGEWIIARGYNDALWDKVPHRHMLDAISPENPVVLRRYCGHAHWVNSKALELAGVTAATPSPDAGIIMRDARGDLSGVLVSAAGALVTDHIPPPEALTYKEELKALKLGSDTLLASGITTVHCATPTGLADVALRRDAYEKGLLRVRLMDALEADAAKELGKPLIGLYNDSYSVRWVKMFIDGSLGGRGAAMVAAYSDMPGKFGALRELGQDENAYARLVADLLRIGFATRTHSIGDRGNHVTLNAFEKAMELSGMSPEEARLVVEHAQVLLPEDILRFADRNILASMQPVHATEDMLFVEDRIGHERAKSAYAWRSIIDANGIIAAGSDYWVSPFNPFYGLHAAVTRQDRENNPPGGWFPEQAMTREEALKAYTVWPAYLEFSEDKKGSITKGKLADFVVIDKDYFKIPKEDIHKIQVKRTVLGGKTVYSGNQTSN
ncbi:MAG: amidohydrolase [Bacteroidales bacterium]|nr:amidohydrolase [Bacteroidales bacterium]